MTKNVTVEIEASEEYDVDDEDYARRIAKTVWKKRLEMLNEELEFTVKVSSVEDT